MGVRGRSASAAFIRWSPGTGVPPEPPRWCSDVPDIVPVLRSCSPCGKTLICSHYQSTSDLITVLLQFNISFYPLWIKGLCPKYVLQWSAHGSQADISARTHTCTHTYWTAKPSENKAELCQCKHGPLLWALFPASYLRSLRRSRAREGNALARVPIGAVI